MAALRTAVAAPRSLRRFFSTSTLPAFNSPVSEAAQQQQQPKAEPSTNLFISGLSKRTTTEKLREKATEFGEVVHARVMTDRVTGYSKCYGFVKYATLEDAAKGIEGMDGKFLDGWVIFAEYARPRPQQPRPSENMSSPYGNRSPPYSRQ